MKNPQISKALEVSTAHISPGDAELLDTATIVAETEVSLDNPVIAYKYLEGYFVYTKLNHAPGEVRDFNRACRASGYSESFVKLVAQARRLGCKYLQLDADGVVYKRLAQHEW